MCGAGGVWQMCTCLSVLLNLKLPKLYSLFLKMKIQVFLAFQKYVLCHFTLTKELYYYLFSQTKRNPKRIFTFRKKGEKQK